MIPKRLSLRFRIFVTMILLVLLASVLIAGVTIYQYREQAKDYNQQRLERKETQLKKNIEYVLQGTSFEVKTENLKYIFQKEIYQIADVQKVNFNIYDLEGNLIKSSRASLNEETASMCLSAEVLNNLSTSAEKRFVKKEVTAAGDMQSSYTYITDLKFKPIGILNLPYYEDDSFSNM